jgi:hypothetical protein
MVFSLDRQQLQKLVHATANVIHAMRGGENGPTKYSHASVGEVLSWFTCFGQLQYSSAVERHLQGSIGGRVENA